MFAAFSGASYGIALIALLLVLGHTLYIGVPYIIHFYDNAVRHNANRPSFRGYLRAFAVEWWFALAANLSYPFGLFGRGLRDGYDPAGGPPIVFIHGYMMNRACFFVLYWRLRRMGYRNLYALNLRPLIGALSGQAEGLERLLRMVASGAPNRPLYLIGHSQGGLLLRWVAGGVGHGLNIGKIITLGSPHHGTRIAHLGIGANARDLEPGSASLTGLPEKLEAPLVAFYSDLDQIILPAESAKFGDENRFFSETGHFALLYRAPVFASILKELPPVVAADSMAATASAIESQRHAATTRDASAAAGEGARQVAADHVSSGLGSSSQARTVDNGIVEAEGSAVAAMDASTDDDTQHLAIPERSAAAEASAVRAADDRAAPGMADGGDASDGAGAGANASYEANADDENGANTEGDANTEASHGAPAGANGSYEANADDENGANAEGDANTEASHGAPAGANGSYEANADDENGANTEADADADARSMDPGSMDPSSIAGDRASADPDTDVPAKSRTDPGVNTGGDSIAEGGIEAGARANDEADTGVS